MKLLSTFILFFIAIKPALSVENTCKDIKSATYTNCKLKKGIDYYFPKEIRIKSVELKEFYEKDLEGWETIKGGKPHEIQKGDRYYFVQYIGENDNVTHEKAFNYPSRKNQVDLENASENIQKILSEQEGINAQSDENMATLFVKCKGKGKTYDVYNYAEGEEYHLYTIKPKLWKIDVISYLTDDLRPAHFTCYRKTKKD